ncbi:MAG: S41 family peptidase [Prevotella sp.]
MKKCIIYIIMCIASFSLVSCVDVDEYDNSPQGNFEALWKIMDEHYCFFDYKREAYGLDWNEVRARYSKRIDVTMNSDQLFEVLSEMLAEVKDGHVNLSSTGDFSRYWSWKEGYPANSSDTLYRRYLGTDYKIASGLSYRILDDNIAYVRYDSFQDGIGEGNLDKMFINLMFCQGLILDIRDNGGGNLLYAERLAARFFNERTMVGYIQHKIGTGHSDFSSLEEQWLDPSSNIRWHKPVCVLTNRGVYSAANEFVKYMKLCPTAIIVGDHTGGGAGLPFSSSLPNGWSVRFSACPMYDVGRHNTEFGISPDVRVDLLQSDLLGGEDTIIEAARAILSK